jgi:hypothetical protein
MGKGLVIFLDSPTQPFSLSDDWQWLPFSQGSGPWLGRINKKNFYLYLVTIETLLKG